LAPQEQLGENKMYRKVEILIKKLRHLLQQPEVTEQKYQHHDNICHAALHTEMKPQPKRIQHLNKNNQLVIQATEEILRQTGLEISAVVAQLNEKAKNNKMIELEWRTNTGTQQQVCGQSCDKPAFGQLLISAKHDYPELEDKTIRAMNPGQSVVTPFVSEFTKKNTCNS
jgi:hypothetical protein